MNPQSKIYWDDNEVNLAKKKFNITEKTTNIVFAPSASGPTKRWDINNYISLFEKIIKEKKCKLFIAGGINDQFLIDRVMNSSIGKECVSFSNMTIEETLPIIAGCQYYIGNDTGWGHICAGLNLKSLLLFMDSPPIAYGIYSKNITVIIPEGETIESCGHNTKGKDKISFDNVLNTALSVLH